MSGSNMRDLTVVEWIDSRGCPQGWQLIEDVDSSPVIIKSVGWRICGDETSITLAPHVAMIDSLPEQAQGVVTIPVKCILKIAEVEFSLKKVDSPRSDTEN